jgi:hypothetical protein
VQRNTVASGHGEVGEGSCECDDGGDDMEQALVLCRVSWCLIGSLVSQRTTGIFHDKAVKAAEAISMSTKTTQRVLFPASPATS